MKKITAYLVCGLLVFMVSGFTNGVDFPNFPLPIYPGATNQKMHFDKPAKGVNAATYRVSTVFPARDLTEFYNKEMTTRGFRKYHDPLDALTQFQWNTFNSRTGSWEPTWQPPARYTAKWSNEKDDQLVWVVVDFKPSQKEQQNGTASVSIHVARYSAYLKELDEIKKSTGFCRFGIILHTADRVDLDFVCLMKAVGQLILHDIPITFRHEFSVSKKRLPW